MLILSPFLKGRGFSRRQPLCNYLAHLLAAANFLFAFEGMGIPKRQRSCSHLSHLWATTDFVPWFEGSGIFQEAAVM